MLWGRWTRAAGVAGLLMAVLSACTRPSFLSAPEPGGEPRATVETRVPATLTAEQEAAVTSTERAAEPASVVKEATEAIDLWQQIGQAFTLQAPPRHRGGDPVKLLRYSRRHFTAVTAYSAPYLQHIYDEIERRQLPAEIALIPLLESGYNNAARSVGGTAGLWQFTSGTGRRYGLGQSAQFDGRHDVIAATRAALDYLTSLGERFDGDWLLAFAAYNCGERNVEQAIARNRRRGRPTDFWSLELPSITRHYIPRLLALAQVVRNPSAYGVQLARIPAQPYFEPVRVTAAVELRHLARRSGLAADEFERLNAAYRQRATVGGRANDVLVAFGHGDTVAGLLASLPAAPASRADAGHYVVRAGDNLWTVARRHGSNTRAVARANGLSVNATLHIGQRLRLPGPERVTATPQVIAGVPEGHGAATHYRVQRGDSLWTIARRFKVSIASLKLWNEHVADGLLKPGERLVVQPPPDPGARDI